MGVAATLPALSEWTLHGDSTNVIASIKLSIKLSFYNTNFGRSQLKH